MPLDMENNLPALEGHIFLQIKTSERRAFISLLVYLYSLLLNRI